MHVELGAGLAVWTFEAADADRAVEDAIGRGGDAYAAIVWPAAIAAARELPGRVRAGERVLDLGAGTGLAALAAARLGARPLALDHDPAALRLLGLAAHRQGLGVETCRFDLAGEDPLPEGDVAVLADVLYEAPLARAAARRASEMVRRGGRVLVSDPGRFARDDFSAALAELGLQAEFEERRVVPPGERKSCVVGVAWLGRAVAPDHP